MNTSLLLLTDFTRTFSQNLLSKSNYPKISYQSRTTTAFQPHIDVKHNSCFVPFFRCETCLLLLCIILKLLQVRIDNNLEHSSVSNPNCGSSYLTAASLLDHCLHLLDHSQTSHGKAIQNVFTSILERPSPFNTFFLKHASQYPLTQ
jgi:hypothetical protein